MTDGPASPDQEPRTRRARLGTELRRLRLLAGLPGRRIAEHLDIGQASVSRIENGQTVPTLPQVNAWADAVEASTEKREALIAFTEAALNEVESWRTTQQRGLAAIQGEVQSLEATARVRRCFQPSLVPGLLQTAEYARRVFALVDVLGGDDYGAAAARRLERQRILYDEDYEFEFILTEAALRLRIVPPPAMDAQLAHIASVATLSNVTIRVVPLDAEAWTIPWCGFNLYDERGDLDPFVKIELPHAGETINDPDSVALYRQQLDVFRGSTVSFQDYFRSAQTE